MQEVNVYVFVKLTTGEQVLATLVSEDENYIEVLCPMLVKSIPFMLNDKTHERIISSPFCQYTDDKIFTLPKTSVMFLKKMSDMFVPHYKNFVEEHEIPAHLEEMPAEEAEEEQQEEMKFFIEGNDTLN